MSSSHRNNDCQGHGLHGEDKDQQSDVIRRLVTATWLCFAFLIVEVIGGYLAGSLAIMSDAAHLFADLASFGVAIVAARLASLPATDQHTFGLKRAESLAALLSMLSLAVVSIMLALEAIRRLYENKGVVDGKGMSLIAGIGVLVNVALAFVLGVENHVHMPGSHDHDHGHGEEDDDHHHGHGHGDDRHDVPKNNHHDSHNHSHNQDCDGHNHDKHNGEEEHHHNHNHHAGSEHAKLLDSNSNVGDYHAAHKDGCHSTKKHRNINLHAAYLHVMGDLAQSVGVLIAGLVIWYHPDWHIIDPICTLIFCAFVFYSTIGVIRTSISVLLEEVPANINWTDVFSSIQRVEGVDNVHDLHIWSISHGKPSLSVHCSTKGDPNLVLKEIDTVVKKHGINHSTIQIQTSETACLTCLQACNNEESMRESMGEMIV